MTIMRKKIAAKWENWIWALGGCTLLAVVIGGLWDYYYALNDDVLMKDIVSGRYTGQPDGHNIYMLYPISWLLGRLYRLGHALSAWEIPWYGLFLWGCQMFCVTACIVRALRVAKTGRGKATVTAVGVLLAAGLFLREMVFLHYTMVSAMLMGTAMLWFVTIEEGLEIKAFWRDSIPAVVLVWLSFLVRVKMGLLLFPLVCLAGLFRWTQEKHPHSIEGYCKFMPVFMSILMGMLVLYEWNAAAYGSEEWKTFWEYCDARTGLYDYLDIRSVPYEEHEDFFRALGLTRDEYTLLENYNIGLDEKIDAQMLERINEYGNALLREQYPPSARLGDAFADYRYRSFHAQDYPWNLAVFGMYAAVFVLSMANRRFGCLWKLPALAAVRTLLWMYVLYEGRSPERITNSLYLAEFLLLTALLIAEAEKSDARPKGRKLLLPVAAVLLLWGGVCTAQTACLVQRQYEARVETNRAWDALLDYMKQRPEEFFFLDVYSTVQYSEKLFGPDDQLSNYDIMGGWLVRSPLTEEKYRQFGIVAMEEALLEREDVYLVVRAEEPKGSWIRAEDWIRAYYEPEKVALRRREAPGEAADAIRVDGRDVFYIYTVSPD